MFSAANEHKKSISFLADITLKILSKQAIKSFDDCSAESKEDVQNMAFKRAYDISMPLLANAQMGYRKEFHKLLPRMLGALERLEDKALSAWLWGRIYTATQNVGDTEKCLFAGEKLLSLLLDNSMPKNAFSAWAWGYYLANEKNGDYEKYKQIMFNAAVELTTLFKQKSDNQNLSTDAIWAWVMAIQAAANNGDAGMYAAIKTQMLEMTHQKTIDGALSKGLSENDFPAWAKSIVYSAAAKMSDRVLVLDLGGLVTEAIEKAKGAEMVLAETTKLSVAVLAEDVKQTKSMKI